MPPTALGIAVGISLISPPLLWFSGVSNVVVVIVVACLSVWIASAQKSPDPLFTAFDVFMINMERVLQAKTPCNGQVMGVLSFKKLPAEAAVRDSAAALAARYVRFRSLPVAMPRALDSHFAEYADFDAAAHVTQHGARDAAGIAALVDELGNEPLSSALSPWHLDLIPNDSGDGHSVVVLRINHCIADGIRLVQASGSFLTFAANGEPAEVGMLKRMASAKNRGAEKRSKIGLRQMLGDFVEAITMANAPAETRTCVHEPKTLFEPSHRRVCASATVSFAAVKDIRKSLADGVTVNDVVLTAFSASVHAYMLAQGDEAAAPGAEAVLMRAFCAFSMPEKAGCRPQGREMYNNFLMPSMPLEVGGGLSRSERLARVRAIMARVKTSAVAGINAALMKLFIALGLEEVAGDANLQIFGNHSFVYSNVPGFEEKVVAFGEVVESFNAYYNNMVTQTIFLTYCDQLTFNLMTDPLVVKRPDLLVELFKREVEAWHAEIRAATAAR